MKHDETV